ncbi:putative 2-oxoglutarate-dependent dioxygenase AOP1.2 [Dichanthelium oligosanthes]|uniref:2-oxoglutarate-dependent dioxygenase DAO n=1 Tax=Dichanthelium oligosanthes TaxID=888268 RepID=A0A1E5VY25_9POAL|nr:putative 2-oxoglutarate-dependent dioxygenase AOP1.2 [Dichanthelium oligosanthes]
MAAEEAKQLPQLPRIDFSGVDPSAPGAGRWAVVRAQVVQALATFGCFDAHYPALSPDLRAALFDGAVRELFALPVDTKRRNSYGPDKPLYGYLGGIPGLANGYESLAIADRVEPERVQAFADLMWPDGGNAGFCETVHGAAKRIADLEEAVRRMLMEGLGVAKYHDAVSESTRHVFRMSRYEATGGDAEGKEEIRYGTHQDCNTLTIVCQHQVDGLEMQTRDGDWILVRPSSPASLVVMAGNALRAWTNDRVHAPFHRVTVSGDAARYSAILFALPDYKIQAPDELVDDEHPPRFKPHYTTEFIRYCVAQGARHEDKLEAFCGI